MSAPDRHAAARAPGKAPGAVRAWTAVSAAAAVTATSGDLLMLYVANAGRPDLALPTAPPWLLAAGCLLGVLAIPLYAGGYWSVAASLPRNSRPLARLIAGTGAGAALIGAVIHGLTGAAIRRQLAGGQPAGDPLSGVLAAGPLLVALWAVAALLVVAASAAFVRAVWRGAPLFARGTALANPALVTVALAAAALPFELGRAFLLPAAPNLAHVVFFSAVAIALRRRGDGTRGDVVSFVSFSSRK